ncbi:PREDICTED: uncharacterized protein LOC107186420 [Dufourea novaeangliae]|uniref:RRM domain-containing protein n=1 Tax=Dufourea novaeangliae TaxID=178035 RepID=A0A154P8I6_DUFNO|nr:PREDICTED: uncharacterized protein LOC107186420 [Dufourea novaeangliae]KZC08235.1 hypothetical protein WN55_10968 [Dufourea novaeangliae]
MDYAKYYDKRSDSYVVHFPNHKGLSLDELKETFSVYGIVSSISDRGNQFGLCFVYYKHLEDTIRCIDGFQNHSYIKILPHKNKNKTVINEQEKKTQMKNNSNCTHRSSNQFQKNRFSEQSDQRDSSSDTGNSFRATKQNIFKNNATDYGESSDTSLHSLRSTNDDNIKTSSPLRHQLHFQKLKRIGSNTSISSKPDKESSVITNFFKESEIPSLIYNDQKLTMHNTIHSTLNTAVIPAHEVIVANVHPSLGIHYILHLFEKYKPISASLMITVPKTEIRYCHVYFQTPGDALAIEQAFDMYLLHGYYLIVLRSDMLLKVALSI